MLKIKMEDDKAKLKNETAVSQIIG